MALIYGLVCTLMIVLHKLAAWRHNRIKSAYELANSQFNDHESRCKTDEVTVGRPTDYHKQIELLKLFENKELARKRWIKSQKRVDARQRRADWLRKLSGRKLPYTFGLIDMALMLKVVDHAPYVSELLSHLGAMWSYIVG